MARHLLTFAIALLTAVIVSGLFWGPFRLTKPSGSSPKPVVSRSDPDREVRATPPPAPVIREQPPSAPEKAREEAIASRKEEFAAIGYVPGQHRPQSNDPNVEIREDGSVLFVPAVSLANDLHQDAGAPIRDLEILSEIIGIYRQIHKENPVAGLNHEVTASILGKNSKSVSLIDPSHSAINAKGELLDRWGTPFHFHGISSQVMEIQSAGPDGKFGSGDDLVFGGEGAAVNLFR